MKCNELLDKAFERYHTADFIPFDPILVPHRFSKKQDIEIMGFFAAVLAWGQRKTIINKCLELESLFDSSPYDFMLNHHESDLKKMEGFVHRTFNGLDLLYFIDFLKRVYTEFDSLEMAFFPKKDLGKNAVEKGLNHFREKFTGTEWMPDRTSKHIASPNRGSACKRLNMFLRWMVRKDIKEIDFGLWENISPAQLICPLDVHVIKVSQQLGLSSSNKSDWKSAVELTKKLRKFDPLDPVKYDFALFSLGETKELIINR